jgi:hypothetical protein
MENESENKAETPAEIHFNSVLVCSSIQQCMLEVAEESRLYTYWSSRSKATIWIQTYRPGQEPVVDKSE